MMTYAELEAIRLKTLSKVNMRREKECTRIVVGMGECGIAAGAHDVVLKCMEEISKRERLDVYVMQDGKVTCGEAPVVVVKVPGKEDKTFTGVKPEMVAKILDENI